MALIWLPTGHWVGGENFSLSLREQAGMRDGGQIMLRDGDQILRKAWVTLFR